MSPGSLPSLSARHVDAGSLALLARLDVPIAAMQDHAGRIALIDASGVAARPGPGPGPGNPDPGSVGAGGQTMLGWAPALPPGALGDPGFLHAHGVRYPYIAGALANGVGSVDMVVAMARADMMGGFGAAGLDLATIEQAMVDIQTALAGRTNYLSNIVHSPLDPARELALIDLYLRHRVPRISASGYMTLTPALVLYRARGLALAPDGTIQAHNHILGKVSRPEVARELMEPAPASILQHLLTDQRISPRQAVLAARVPMAEDITVEGDSGGLTDNRALVPLLASVCELRDRVVAQQGYDRAIRVGAAGGIGTPATVAAAFAGGAAYVLTGSINQSCVEAGTSALVKEMLCEVDIGGVDMAPAADMFELGARVQVLKHRSLFSARARKLYELYRSHGAWERIPARERAHIEARYFQCSFDEVCHQVEDYLAAHNPAELEAVRRHPGKRLARAFRWYLHMGTRWAVTGAREREADFQVWCGPAMAAFNHWVRGSALEPPSGRRVALVAQNLLHGAAALERARFLAMQGVPLPAEAFRVRPTRFD